MDDKWNAEIWPHLKGLIIVFRSFNCPVHICHITMCFPIKLFSILIFYLLSTLTTYIQKKRHVYSWRSKEFEPTVIKVSSLSVICSWILKFENSLLKRSLNFNNVTLRRIAAKLLLSTDLIDLRWRCIQIRRRKRELILVSTVLLPSVKMYSLPVL